MMMIDKRRRNRARLRMSRGQRRRERVEVEPGLRSVTAAPGSQKPSFPHGYGSLMPNFNNYNDKNK